MFRDRDEKPNSDARRNQAVLESLQDAFLRGASLPVVSLRSTTGYGLSSLRDE